MDFAKSAKAHDDVCDALEVLQEELMTVYNVVPDLFGKPPSGLSATDKLKVATAFLQLGERILGIGSAIVIPPLDVPVPPLKRFVKEKE